MPFKVALIGDVRSVQLLNTAAQKAVEAFDVTTPADHLVEADILVLGPTASDPFGIATAFLEQRPSSQVLFLLPRERLSRFRETLPFVPRMASAWTADSGGSPEALANLLFKAARSSSERASLLAAKDWINKTISRPRISQGGDSDADLQRLRQLALSERYMATLLRQAPDAFVALTPSGAIAAWNAAAERLLGVAAKNAVGAHWQEVFPSDLCDSIAPLLATALTGSALQEQEMTYSSGQGKRHLALTIAPVVDESGAIASSSITLRDITEKHRAETKLRDSEALVREANTRLEQLLEQSSVVGGRFWDVSPDLIIVLDGEARIARANPAWLTTLGWSNEELTGTVLFELLHADDVVLAQEALDDLRRGNLIRNLQCRCHARDGTFRWIAWAAVPLGESYYASGRDITAEKDTESNLRTAQEALRQSQKMEAVGQLTGGLAHDFNNLLAGITGSLELLTQRISQGRLSETDRYISSAQGAAKRAASLTQRLLAFARRQTLDSKPTDVNRLVSGMEELLRRTVGPLNRVETILTGGLWTVEIDANQLENALLNLCINARDAMPDGGLITIETANRWFDERTSLERTIPQGQYISLSVTDNGTGMTPEVMARAFDPFFTTKPIGTGTGLGLSMIHGFAIQSGGQVRIYSELDKGTTVSIYLPRSTNTSVISETKQPSANITASSSGETVLVVDDEPTVRMLVADVLQELGYAVIEAGDGKEGLSILQSGQKIDLLITDVGLPNGMNGRQMADAARQWHKNLQTLFITGYAENAVMSHGHLEPGMHILTKPFSVETLAMRVKEMLGTRKSTSNYH